VLMQALIGVAQVERRILSRGAAADFKVGGT